MPVGPKSERMVVNRTSYDLKTSELHLYFLTLSVDDLFRKFDYITDLKV